MAIEVGIETTIERPPEVVYATIVDLERWPGWLVASGIRAVRREREGPLVAGERLIVEQDAAGRAATFDAEITSIDDTSRLALRGRDRDGVTIHIETEVGPAPDSDGEASELWWSVRIGLPLRYRMFESMARPQVERAALLDIEGLRVRLEAADRD